MKNISRRVFIKGMAVAAVATAASTVLTGCKLPVGPEEPEVVPTPANSFTYTVDGKSLAVSSEKFEIADYGNDDGKENVYFFVSADNNLGKVVNFKAQADEDAYIVSAKVSFLDKNGVEIHTALANDSLSNYTNFGTGSVAVATDSTKNGVYFAKDVPSKWASAVLTLTVYKPYTVNGTTRTDKDAEYKFNYTNA